MFPERILHQKKRRKKNHNAYYRLIKINLRKLECIFLFENENLMCEVGPVAPISDGDGSSGSKRARQCDPRCDGVEKAHVKHISYRIRLRKHAKMRHLIEKQKQQKQKRGMHSIYPRKGWSIYSWMSKNIGIEKNYDSKWASGAEMMYIRIMHISKLI